MFKVTKEWLKRNTTGKNGYRATQIRALGYSYPPPKGWLRNIVGKEITLAQRDAFEAGSISKELGRQKVRDLQNYNKCLQYGWFPPATKPPKTTKTPKRQRVVKTTPATQNDFLQTFEWRQLRMKALKQYGAKCMCCGATPQTGAVMNVDHIKPRKIFPELALDITNLQILCNECNHGKGNWDMTDWRTQWTDSKLSGLHGLKK